MTTEHLGQCRRISGNSVFAIAYLFLLTIDFGSVSTADEPSSPSLTFSHHATLPDDLGVAGPFAGVHNDALVIAGGANFPRPVWEHGKEWHDRIHVLISDGNKQRWIDGGRLPRPIGYGASVSTPQGIVCMGGNDADHTFDDVFLIQFNQKSGKITITDYPSLPAPTAFASATVLNNVIYLAGGQTGQSLESATNQFFSLDLSQSGTTKFKWKSHESVPWSGRAFHITASLTDHNQSRGEQMSLYVISGRAQSGTDVKFLKDVWQFTPSKGRWKRKADVPHCVMAGLGIEVGNRQILVLGGDDGSLFGRADELKDSHPGFRKEALYYSALSNRWTAAATMPVSHVTTIPVLWKDSILIPSGEVRPRVRSAKIWRVQTSFRRNSEAR